MGLAHQSNVATLELTSDQISSSRWVSAQSAAAIDAMLREQDTGTSAIKFWANIYNFMENIHIYISVSEER